ncbi:MAG: serpin family protein [Euryarchaeota archaeon]|nr:serpin family protein [Euryarchaeota archaeon]
MKLLKIIGVLAVCMVITAGVYAGMVYTNIVRPPWSPPQEPDISGLNDPMNDFALRLYKELCSKTNDSVFFSPYSIYIALAMAFEGARTSTAEEIGHLLGYQQGNSTMLSTLYRLWQIYNNNTAFNLSTANALWLSNDFKILDDYIEKITTYFAGRASEVDFSNPVHAAKIINDWVEQNTNGRIKDLVPPGAINSLTRLILTNAIYFKGTWKYPFDKNITMNESFFVSSIQTVQVPMMKLIGTDILFNYTETETVQVLELTYAGDNITMLIILPKDQNLERLEQNLTLAQLKEWKNALYQTNIDIMLPKFKLETSYTLNDPLQKMGMVHAFSDADFSGITGGRDMFISSVLHKAFIEVNEEGTEAAATTAIVLFNSVGPGHEQPRLVFNADHPFLFIIQHNDTGTILFMGKIVNLAE